VYMNAYRLVITKFTSMYVRPTIATVTTVKFISTKVFV